MGAGSGAGRSGLPRRLSQGLSQALLRTWFQPRPTGLAQVLRPLALLYGLLQRLDRRRRERQARRQPQPAVPVVVVGNLVPGGAGKTPTTIALVQALRAAGWRPGVVSRGHGRRSNALQAVTAQATPQQVGDEPLLIWRRCAVPVVVARNRRLAALQLLQWHPKVNVIVADDGLQHRQLQRQVEVLVLDERGLGNGLLLPAGPLREPMPHGTADKPLLLYTQGPPSTPWAGAVATRRLSGAWPLPHWLAGAAGQRPTDSRLSATREQLPGFAGDDPWPGLRGRPLLAMAGIAVPERFFAALEAQGLSIERLPLPDHHDYGLHAPWPAATAEIVTTEKDAVKLAALAGRAPPTWVVGLDLVLPADFVAALLARLARALPP